MAIADNDPRVFFAAERTLLAWLRTGLTVMALGFMIARFGLFLQLLSLQAPAGRFQANNSVPAAAYRGQSRVSSRQITSVQPTYAISPSSLKATRPRSMLSPAIGCS